MRPRYFFIAAALLLLAWWVARSLYAPPWPQGPLQFSVRGDLGWQSTGVVVPSRASLEIQYISGTWSPWPGSEFGARGSGGDPYCDCNVLKGASHASLIGRVGEGEPFFVGDTFRSRVREAGPLFLRINDQVLGDNSGDLTVDITASL